MQAVALAIWLCRPNYLIEACFGILTRKSIRRASFNNVRGLVRHIERYLDEWNQNPTPFVWTKERAEIIRKAVRR